ncbi:MAG: hypothetical protein JW940_34490 [Polyangiaceae bacterium]|nr:hypothetical protein [Polyangiaceae bacterium]
MGRVVGKGTLLGALVRQGPSGSVPGRVSGGTVLVGSVQAWLLLFGLPSGHDDGQFP